MQIGSHPIQWDVLSKFLYCDAFWDKFPGNDTLLFVQDVLELRSRPGSDEAISSTLFGLAYRFRVQSATFGSDKLYALLGLLESDNPRLLIPDYSQSPNDVFLAFVPSYLAHSKNLTVVALAAGAVTGVSIMTASSIRCIFALINHLTGRTTRRLAHLCPSLRWIFLIERYHSKDMKSTS